MFYVTMTDKFMSGWGLAEGKINKLAIECETLAEAEIVEANARRRSEMKHVNICGTKPRYGKGVLVSWHIKQDYESWFKPNAWNSGWPESGQHPIFESDIAEQEERIFKRWNKE